MSGLESMYSLYRAYFDSGKTENTNHGFSLHNANTLELLRTLLSLSFLF
jgi:zona occludens toxin (predicted ATPase)